MSLTMTPYGYIADSVVGRITLTLLDSGSVEIVLRRVVGQCDAIAAGVERPVLKLLLLQLLGILVKVKGETKALLAETPCLDPAMCRPRFGSLVLCLLEDHLVQGLGPYQVVLIHLCYLEICLEGSSFFRQSCLLSKYEKMVTPPSKEERTKEREQLLWQKVQSQNRMRKQEAGHVDQIAKLEADAAKQRTML